MDVKDKVFLVSGGSTGLGSGAVATLAHKGAQVVIVDIRRDAAEQLIIDLKEEGAPGEVTFQRIDVNDSDAVGRGVPKIADRQGAMHGLVSCAGSYPYMPMCETGDDASSPEWHRIDTFIRCLHINLVGTFSMVRAVLPMILDNTPDTRGERGTIIATSSNANEIGHLALSAAAGGIDGMLSPLCKEFSPQGIRFNTIAPSYIKTRMWREHPESVQSRMQAQAYGVLPGKVSDFGELAAHIIENPMLNGQRLALDMGGSI